MPYGKPKGKVRHICSLIQREGELSPQQHFPGEEEAQNLTSSPLPAEGTLVLVGKDWILLSPWLPLLYSVGRVLLLAKKAKTEKKKNRKTSFSQEDSTHIIPSHPTVLGTVTVAQ